MEIELRETALRWMEGDPDPETRAEVQALLDADDEAALVERFAAPLEFGTAGLRGVVGGGPGRMNRAVVLRTTRALAEYLLAHGTDPRSLPVVVGRDARLSSETFLRDTVEVLAAAGIPVRYFDEPAPTPLVAFAARELGAAAAVIITASHNPPEYNGYKLYGPDAIQIVSPVDEEMARRIEKIGPASAVPLEAPKRPSGTPPPEPIPSSVVDRYLSRVAGVRSGLPADRDIEIVYTPLHGVGGKLTRRAFADAGYGHFTVVEKQAAPDGHFPTVRFPNPEEPGALDLAIEEARRKGADLILANDPDADRLGVCVPTPSGRWLTLSGNQIGCLLAERCLEVAPPRPNPLIVSSIVSSPLAGLIARAHGARHEQTLTGFKWVWNAALELSKSGAFFVFGFEEALGYCIGDAVRDKDGISAALGFAELAAEARAEGQTVLERLGALYRRHGLWVSTQKSIVRPGVSGAREIAEAMERIAGAPPAKLGDHDVTAVVDYRTGAEKRPRWLGEATLIQLDLGERGRVLIRPSGTEPKLKIYVDLGVPLGDGAWLAAEEALLDEARGVAERVAVSLGFA